VRLAHAAAAALAGAALAAGVAGCGLGAGPRTSSAVSLTVSRDFGAGQLGAASAPSVPGSESVMRFLQQRFSVKTRNGGGFVQSIDGLARGQENGRPVDWFFFVNGILSPVGATQATLRAGDRIWWDRHDGSASGTNGSPAVVGSFPAPFTHDLAGKRPPVRLECAPDAGAACDRVAQRLRAGGGGAGGGGRAPGPGRETLRVLVGSWTAIRRDNAAAPLERGPTASGVYVRPTPSGRTFAVLNPAGGVARSLTGGTGLVAATRFEKQEPAWLVTGTDPAGTLASADELKESSLAHRFALVVSGGRLASAPKR